MIDFLLEGPLGCEELRAQADSAQVSGYCSCGCPSVQLAVDRSLPPARLDEAWVPIKAEAVGTTVEVTLHVIDGYLHELEIWDGTKSWSRPPEDRIEVPAVAELRYADD